ncbi:MAG: ABC transporter permease [Clostridia bacterium]|nr:ABC transporter permease [Clostridia bacterium]
MLLFGILLGILIGFILSVSIIEVIGNIIKYMGEAFIFEKSTVKFTMNFPTYLIGLIASIAYIIVCISILIPLRKIKNGNIINEVKGIKKSKRKNTPFIIKKLFKQEGELAYQYTKREKARNITIVSSITISVCLFLIISGISVNFLKKAKSITYNDYVIDVPIEKDKEVIEYLKKNNLINGYFEQTKAFQLEKTIKSSYNGVFAKIPRDKISDNMIELIEKNKNSMLTQDTSKVETEQSNETYEFTILPYYFNEEAYQEILKRVGVNELKENECILLNSQSIENSTYGNSFEITKYTNGDKIEIYGQTMIGEKNICDLQIAGVINNFEPYTPQNYQLIDYNTVIIVMLSKDKYEKELEDKTISLSSIYISTDNAYEIDNRMEEIENISKDMAIFGENLYETRMETESFQELFKFILYMIIIMITVFSMTNIYYIISSSTNLRKKDFAVLRALGMSEKQINKMLFLEGVFYGASGLCIGTIFSFWILYLISRFAIDTELYLFEFPFIHILYAVIIVYVTIYIAMMIARTKIKKRNIISDITMEKI